MQAVMAIDRVSLTFAGSFVVGIELFAAWLFCDGGASRTPGEFRLGTAARCVWRRDVIARGSEVGS